MFAGIGLPIFLSCVNRIRSRMSTSSTRSAASGLLLSAAASGPPNQEPTPEFIPLLSLPRDVLAIVIAEARRHTGTWRLVCTQLRDMVDGTITSLGCPAWGQRGLVFTSMLIMRLPRLTRVFISACIGIEDLTPLVSCIALQYLNCSHTAVSNLEPLSFCKALHILECGNTKICSLAPLSFCKALHTLDFCDCSAVSSLEPLAMCTLLHALRFFGCSAVSSLAPLAACTSLHTLDFFGCSGVSCLEPLSACTSLHSLDCLFTAVTSLAPLATCLALKELKCNSSLSRDFDFMKKSKITHEYVGCCTIFFP